ncbi:UNVERIFIED_CONTAM: hypothetical protein PYX00_002682 [Menopon gallinae]|uniref:PX domain-containing protein n=1 Tax=Menopon gallinae TaxID=328185 RepID=A0AAW2HXG2_9NEOP
MNKPKKWLERLNNICLHEKIVLFSLSLVLLVLGFDCFFKNLPVSGYPLVFVTVTLIGGTTWGTCHGIKWLLHCNKPLKFHLTEKSQNETFLGVVSYIYKMEDAIFDKLFKGIVNSFNSFNYPTTVNEQIRLFLKDTERDFVTPWYSEISQNSSFLFDTHLLLEEILLKIVEKLKSVNCKNLVLNVLLLYLNHLQEYKKSLKKLAKAKANVKQNDCDECEQKEKKVEESVIDLYRYSHPSSQSDGITNYYLKKVAKWMLQEYAPQEFVISLQCKILTGVLARKVLRACLTTFEDPVWIYIRLIYILDASEYKTLLGNKVYCVKEKIVEVADDTEELQVKKPIVIPKRYMKSSLLHESTNLFQRKEFGYDYKQKGVRNGRRIKNAEQEALNLSLESSSVVEEHGYISSVLGGIISSTAGPLLPDDASLCYEPLNKMWQSPVTEKPRAFADPEADLLGKSVVDGVRIDSRHQKNKRLPRSKSTDSVSPGDVNEPLKVKDVSVGEELCESVRFASTEDVHSTENADEDRSKQRSATTVKKLVKTRSFDSGSIAIDCAAVDFSAEADVQAISEEPKEAGSVSPVYEEPEDFATTIAKLRSLLQQRESSSTLSDKSAQSLDLPSNVSAAETSDSSNRTQSTDLDSSFDSQVAPDMPTDGRPFINVCIPKTELITDGCGSPYILYSIQYDGIYKLKDQNNSEESELVLQTTVVKRKFQEFVKLQSRLEECSYLRSAMKGVRGPSKWLNLAFSGKTDESNPGNRKQALEQFLQQLCSKVEICAAPELHEFLAYGSSGNKALFKKDTESSIRRIDKVHFC